VRPLAVVLALAAAALPGCSAGGGGGDARAELESMIREQLPDSAKRNGATIYTPTVRCTSVEGNRFDCIATVRGIDDAGTRIDAQLPITASCDDRSCVWKADQGF
jgi:hypothetical protein